MFVDLTAAYNAVWHHGLTWKLLRLLPDRHMVHTIMGMVDNGSFTLNTGNGKRSRLRRLKNGVPHCPGAPSLQHLHLWPSIHRLQKVCIYWRLRNFSEYHGDVSKPPIHETYTVTFVEEPNSPSLNLCEDKWYHRLDAQINIQNMILPRVR